MQDNISRSEKPLKILVARLSPESSVGLSFSHTLIEKILTGNFGEKVVTDLFFFPENNEFAGLRSRNARLVSKRNSVPLRDFDIIAVSNSVPMEVLNIYNILSMSGIALKSSERSSDPDSPLVIIGGINTPSISCVTGDPDGPSKDPAASGRFFDDGSGSAVDAIFMGEAEASLPDFIKLILSDPDWKSKKHDILKTASETISGIYFPAEYIHKFECIDEAGRREMILRSIEKKDGGKLSPVPAAIIKNIDALPPFSEPVSEEEAGSASVPVEITRGCASMCSFCKEGYTQKPYREKSKESIISCATAARQSSGIGLINLYSYNFNDHSNIHGIVESLIERGMVPRVKSQRIDRSVLMPNLIKTLFSMGSASPTFAVEGVSKRIRAYLSKNIDDKTLSAFSETVFISKPRQLKLFFIATGLENESDLKELSSMMSNLLNRRREHSPATQVVVSLMPIVNPQKTPLMFAPCEKAEKLFTIMKRISQMFASYERVVVRNSINPGVHEITQILEAGGRELSRALHEMTVREGFAFYDGAPDKLLEKFIKSVEKYGFSFSAMRREKNEGDVLASDDREYGIKRGFLYGAWVSAKKFENIEKCLRNGTVKCQGCGACENEISAYENINAASMDKKFASARASLLSQIPPVRVVCRAETDDGSRTPFGRISKILNGKTFQTADDAISKTGLTREKFYGKNFFLLNVFFAGEKDINEMKDVVNTKSLDFLAECNYLFLRAILSKKIFKARPEGVNKAAVENVFLQMNAGKCKPASAVIKGAGNNICLLNSDGLKKHVNLPFIMYDPSGGCFYMIAKNTPEVLSAVEKAKILEYIKISEYNLKSSGSCCPQCGRVFSASLPLAGEKDYEYCFMCDLIDGGIGLYMN